MPDINSLSNEERIILKRCSNQFLFLLIDIYEHKNFDSFKGFVDSIIDIEKDSFFAEKEDKIDPTLLAIRHAKARGKIIGMDKIYRLIVGAKFEMERRKEETRKKREERKIKKEQE